MEFPRAPAPKLDPIKKSLRFQIIDWFIPENDKAKRQIQQEMDWNKPADLYQIYIFGSTEEGHSVCCEVNDFEPYFFVRMPEKWWIGKSDKQMKASVTSFRMELEEAQIESRNGMPRSVIPKRLKDHLVYLKVIKRKDFWGFTNGEDFPFMKVRVKSLAMYNTMKRYFADRIRSDIRKGLTDKETFKLYESNIDPFLRFIHEQNIAPCGWVELPQKQYELLDESLSRAAYNVSVSYKYVKPLEINKIAPLLIASFDIECSSSHGDFPVARKDYRKLAMELIQVARTNPRAITAENMKELIMDAFEKEVPLENNVIIHRIYPKKKILRKDLSKKLDAVIDNIIEELQYVTKTKNASGVTNDDGSEEEDEDAPTRSMSNAVYEKITKDLLVHLGTYIEKKGDNPFSKPEQKWHGALPELEGDQVIQIGTTVHRYGSDEIVYRHIVTLNTCDDIEGSAVEYYDTEEAMLDAWKYFITKLDPDILTGYNIFGFDMKYIWERAKELGMDTEFGTGLGRLSERQTTLLEQRLSSSALGDNFLYYIDMDGVVSIDMLKVMQRDQKLDSYKLDNVSQVFLGDQKDDLKPREIFEKFYGSSADRCVIAKYCLQDCALVNRLLHKLKVLENNVGMGNVCSVPLSYLFMRGQGIKIFSLVAKECRANRYLIPVLRDFNDEQLDDEEGYEGAIVLDPQEGMYLEDPITVLDYASLYPSSMIARNLSHDCYVNDEKYANLEAEGIQYVKVSYDIYEGKGDDKKAVGKKECTFAQLPDNKKGIIPNILNKLLTQRKNTRKKIEYERLTLKDGRVAIGLVKEKPDGTVEILNVDNADIGSGFGGHKAIIPADIIENREEAYSNFEQAVLDALQLAYKVTANSLYGQIGSRVSPIYLKDIAACTTATGRDMIMRAKKFVETRYGAEVIYGDSVTGYTPILIRHIQDNSIRIETIDKLAEKYGKSEWKQCLEEGKQEKEYCELYDVEVWSDQGWTKMYRVMRHMLADHKKIIRVNTHSGIVDVTDDHSLLRLDKSTVSPKDLIIGDALCHSPYPLEIFTEKYDKFTLEEARIFGFFCGDGSCGKYYCKSGIKSSWGLNNADMELQMKYKNLCEIVYPELDWKINNTIQSSGVYKLVPSSRGKTNGYGKIVELVDKYRKLMYYNNEKIVPVEILQASYSVRKAFWDGLYDADGDKEGVVTRIDQKNQLSISIFQILAESLGYNTSINSRKDKLNIYRLNLTKNKQRKDPYKIKKIYEIPYSGYVYDVTTENHHFQAGVGKIIVHNTDSIFIKFTNRNEKGEIVKGKEALPYAIKAGQLVEKEINSYYEPNGEKYLPEPESLAYEKTLFPFIILSKKRYVGNLYEDDATKKPKQKSMGIVLKRRDNAPIVKKIYGGIIDILLNRHDLNASVEFLRGQLQDLVDGKVPLEELIITKTLRAEYKDPTKIAHKVLADRMGERDEGNKPAANDRVPFIYIQAPDAQLQGDRIEHPEYIREMKLTPDYRFYITNQLMKPICQLYALCIEQLEDYAYSPTYWMEMDKELAEKPMYKDPRKRKNRIEDLRNRCASEILFEPYLIQLGDAPKRKSAPSASKLKEEAKIRRLANISAKPITHEITLVVTDPKAKAKDYTGTVTYTNITNSTVLWKNVYTFVKKEAQNKLKCQIKMMEQTFDELFNKNMLTKDGAIRIKANKFFAGKWKKALVNIDDLGDQLKKAIETQDYGAFEENAALQLFIRLVSVADKYPYVIETL